MRRSTTLSLFPIAGALWAVPAWAQTDVATHVSHPGHEARAPASRPAQTAATADNLNVPATDFSGLKPALPANTSGSGRRGSRRGSGGARPGMTTGF